jgi:hypothetical protein
MNDVLVRGVEAIDGLGAAEPEPAAEAALLVEPYQATGCYPLSGDHSPEEVTACLERWLAAIAGQGMLP